MLESILGIDIGTSSCKVAVFDSDGTVVAQAKEDYPVYYPMAGWAEQDPKVWWKAVCQGIKRILEQAKLNPRAIKGIGVAGQSWSAIAVDKRGEVLCNTPIWMDTRADEICSKLKDEMGDKIFEICGNPFKPSYTTPKILWYKQKRPDMYKKIYKIMQSNSYIGYRLTGNITQDISQGYGLHCFNMRTGSWDVDMCKELGIDIELLPEIFSCHDIIGTVTYKAAQETGLMPGTPVVAGGLDAACGTLGAGVVSAGQTQEQGGQAGGMSICIKEYMAHPNLILGYHVVPDTWLLQGGTVGGSGTLRWFENEFGFEERIIAKKTKRGSFEIMDEKAAGISAGSDGVIFLPYMAGERSPIWDKNACGVYFGLDFSKTKAHILRATMEGVAYSLLHNLQTAEEVGAQVDDMYSIGGAANSRLWTQIKADVTGKTIHVPLSDTATTLGAAMLAGVGTGMYKDFFDAVSHTVRITRTHEPDIENHNKYKELFKIYLEIYDKLKDTMKYAREMEE